MSIPYPSVLRARCGCTAPIFCATKTEMDCIKADGTSMINPHSFSATPTPAEAITPIAFTMAIRTRKEMLTRTSCNATGMPSFRIRPVSPLRKRMYSFRIVKGKPRFRIIHNVIATLTACAATVAIAAPAVPI